jgi:hypothetical protein
MLENSVNLMRCLVHKVRGPENPGEVRWIPFNEFDLWKFMVSSQHHLTVEAEALYFYIPREEYERHEPLYSRLPQFPVNKITLYFFLKPAQVLVPISRYFPAEEYDRIKPTFLSHFKAFEDRNHSTKFLEDLAEESGVCLQPQGFGPA